MSTAKYSLPDFLKGKCERAKYARWLHRKAQAHASRDRKRNGKRSCTVSLYKEQIHSAVVGGGDRDFYTGEPLDWTLISTFENIAAKSGRSLYKKAFELLPTVDHTFDDKGRQKFVICSWKINDAKSDLTLEEFYTLCETVLSYRNLKRKQT
jgi:hypothetical protein